MHQATLIQNAKIVNEGKTIGTDLLIEGGVIQKIGQIPPRSEYNVIDGSGKHLLPGVIDGQVHYRDPGLTHKADLYTESKAAIAGGVTSFIDMPNTVPNILDYPTLDEKRAIAAKKSLANYAFFLGVNGDNVDEIVNTDTSKLIGVSDDGLYFTKKGNLLADNPETMENCSQGVSPS